MFEQLLQIIKTGNMSLVTDEIIEDTFKAGVYHGLFSEENYGFHDRKNSVYCLIGTLCTINGVNFPNI